MHLLIHLMQTIEGYYADGVSLTHGSPGSRQHIWTFAAGYAENSPSRDPTWACPCADRATAISRVPSFVGNDYFCQSGNPNSFATSMFYSNDPLWDGQGCGSSSCCELSYPPGVSPPWFCKQLPQTTTDDIEIRICGERVGDEDTPVELIEIYINQQCLNHGFLLDHVKLHKHSDLTEFYQNTSYDTCT